jgi:hypothetical protein
MKIRFAFVGVVLGCGSLTGWLQGCGGGGALGSTDAGVDAAADAGGAADTSFQDASPDGTNDGSPAAPAMKIVTTNGAPLRGGPGDALNLQVVLLLADGGTVAVPAIQTSWIAPETLVAQDPNDAGPSSVLPEAGVKATAFFVTNEYSGQYGPGALFIVDPGGGSDAGVTVTASVSDAGQVSAWISILPVIDGGDPTRGQNLFQNMLLADNLACSDCHGPTAAGSPPQDGGEAGATYELPESNGDLYTYPAPGLNNRSSDAGPNLAADPSWSAALLGMAIQADIDNQGVALRGPMPDFFQAPTNDAGATLNSQDFADMYAWLKTQPR